MTEPMAPIDNALMTLMDKSDNDRHLTMEQRAALRSYLQVLKSDNAELLEACERAKLAFETILDMGFMPSSDYDSDTKILINMMDKTIKKVKGEK